MSFFNGDIKTNEFVLKSTINTATLSTDEDVPSEIEPCLFLIIDPSSHPGSGIMWYIDISHASSDGYVMKIIVPRGTDSSNDYLMINFQGQTNHSAGTLASLGDIIISEGKQMDFIYYNDKWYPNIP